MKLSEIINAKRKDFVPLFDPDLTKENTLKMDFSSDNLDIQQLDFKDVTELNEYIFNKITNAGKVYGYGGYLEDRELYKRSRVFDVSPNQSRSIHLGIDVWTEVGKPVNCPLEAKVHSFNFNNSFGDYGPTIILEHTLLDQVFYSLYGHLRLESLHNLYEGKYIKKGERFCEVGDFPINGDWPPHLHFQIIADMKDKKGDYPGVCSYEDKEKYIELCPDPVVFFSL